MTNLKAAVHDHSQEETCGTRYGELSERCAFFEELSRARFALEPYIPLVARCHTRAHATGTDRTYGPSKLTAERLDLAGAPRENYTLRQAAAEQLPFADASRPRLLMVRAARHSRHAVRIA